MGFLQDLLSLTWAGMMLIATPLQEAAPHQDVTGDLFLVNRDYMISEDYVPYVVDSGVTGQVRNMTPEAGVALKEMFAACKKAKKITLKSVSGYRSYYKQQTIYKSKLKSVKGNVDKAQQYVAPPGTSEHQLGIAMDVAQSGKVGLVASFGDTKGGKWLAENCWKYGFILRYNAGWEEITGYSYEPWHFRYVGKEFAKEIHESGLPLETWLIGYRTDLLKELTEGIP